MENKILDKNIVKRTNKLHNKMNYFGDIGLNIFEILN